MSIFQHPRHYRYNEEVCSHVHSWVVGVAAVALNTLFLLLLVTIKTTGNCRRPRKLTAVNATAMSEIVRLDDDDDNGNDNCLMINDK